MFVCMTTKLVERFAGDAGYRGLLQTIADDASNRGQSGICGIHWNRLQIVDSIHRSESPDRVAYHAGSFKNRGC